MIYNFTYSEKVVQASCFHIVDLLKFLFKLCITSSSVLLEFRILYEIHVFGKGYKKKTSPVRLWNLVSNTNISIYKYILGGWGGKDEFC